MSREHTKQAVSELANAINNGASIEKCYQYLKTVENCLWTEKVNKFEASLAAVRNQAE